MLYVVAVLCFMVVYLGALTLYRAVVARHGKTLAAFFVRLGRLVGRLVGRRPRVTAVHNLFILDESGSMDCVREATVRGFNELVQTVQALAREFPDKRQLVSLTTFNDEAITEKLFMQPAAALQPLTLADYEPNSSTPLFDAIGQSVTHLRNRLEAEGSQSQQVLVTVLTDGLENASKEYTRHGISQLIKGLQARGWLFTYIGANHDVTAASASLSIKSSISFQQTDAGMDQMFAKERAARRRYNRNPDDSSDYFGRDSKGPEPEA